MAPLATRWTTALVGGARPRRVRSLPAPALPYSQGATIAFRGHGGQGLGQL